MRTTTMNDKPAFRITGRMVFFGLVAFFGLIAAVNGVFMFYALDTFPGLTTEDSYKKGIVYNRTLDDAEARRRLPPSRPIMEGLKLASSLGATYLTDALETALRAELRAAFEGFEREFARGHA